MINNKIYYKIAEHFISVEGNVEAMALLDGFEVFAVNSQYADLHIKLTDYLKKQSIGKTYYTLDTKFVNCHFTKHEAGYGLSLVADKGKELLSLKYISANKSCEISGNLNPALLKLALWTAFGLAVIENNAIAVHASAIIFRRKALLFLGESGTGKSTHAELWNENIKDVTSLNDDSPIIRVEGDKCYAYGSPWSGKTPCYKQSKIEIAAIIRLSKAPHNQIRLLSLHEAVAALYPSFPPAFSADKQLVEQIYGILSDILKQTPIYHLNCLPNRQAVQLVVETIWPLIYE